MNMADEATFLNYLRAIGHGDHQLRLILADWYGDQTGNEAVCAAIRAAPDCEQVLHLFPVAGCRVDWNDLTCTWRGACELWPEWRALAWIELAVHRIQEVRISAPRPKELGKIVEVRILREDRGGLLPVPLERDCPVPTCLRFTPLRSPASRASTVTPPHKAFVQARTSWPATVHFFVKTLILG